jgi:hypothetical protein
MFLTFFPVKVDTHRRKNIFLFEKALIDGGFKDSCYIVIGMTLNLKTYQMLTDIDLKRRVTKRLPDVNK